MEIKDFSKSKSVKVNCSFCGNEMECPEEMLATSNTHMCFNCFNEKKYPDEELKNVHVDIPMNEFDDHIPSEMADQMIEKVFPGLWSNKKGELKEMSKKELAEEMFGTGIYLGIKAFLETMKKAEQGEEHKEKEDDAGKNTKK